MRPIFRNKQLGVTLIEMMLVTVVISMMFMMFIGYSEQRARTLSIDRASQQIQQILNGALSYYLANTAWPPHLSNMQPPNTPYVIANIKSPWGTDYLAEPIPNATPGAPPILFKVTVSLPNGLRGADAIGAVLAGKIPFGESTSGVVPTVVTAVVNLPGQDVNNATAVNFAGLYHNGACIPMPTCPPTDGSGNPMTPEVIIVPVSLSGAYDAGTTNVYPITSFTAFASGPPSLGPASCPGATVTPACDPTTSSTKKFWRACMQVVTSKGTVDWDPASTAQYPVMMGMTRCIVKNEPAGSDFSVFGD